MKKILSSILILAMLFTLAPTVFAADKYTVQFDKTAYEVEAGGKLTVPVYVSKPDGTDATFMIVQINVPIPDGFTAEATKGVAASASIVNGRAKFFKGVDNAENAFICGKGSPFGTITLTAPTTPGTYNLGFYKPELYDLESDDTCVADVSLITATITVTGGSSEPTLTSISATPEKITVKYNEDIQTVIDNTAINVTAMYSDGNNKPVAKGEYEGELSADGKEYVITYGGKECKIAIEKEPAPVLGVENTDITIPYTEEATVDNIKSKLGKVTLNGADVPADKINVEYTAGDTVAKVSVKDDRFIAPVNVNVTVVTVASVEITAISPNADGKVVYPFGTAEDNIKAELLKLISVKATLTDSTVVEDKDIDKNKCTVNYTDGKFTVTHYGVDSNELEAVEGEEQISTVGFEVVEKLVDIPYGTENVEDYVAKHIKVNAIDNKENKTPLAIGEFSVSVAEKTATITYKEFKAVTITIDRETIKGIEVTPDTFDNIEEGTFANKASLEEYVKSNVKAKHIYGFEDDSKSALTEPMEIAKNVLTFTASDDLKSVTVDDGNGNFKVVTVNYIPKPDYIVDKQVSDVYGIPNSKLVTFKDVADGKVLKITDTNGTFDATYMGNGKWAAVVVGDYTVVPMADATPEAAKFGRLHDESMVTAYDALITLLRAKGGDVKIFKDAPQKYLLADMDADGALSAEEALYVNRISLGTADTAADKPWFEK